MTDTSDRSVSRRETKNSLGMKPAGNFSHRVTRPVMKVLVGT